VKHLREQAHRQADAMVAELVEEGEFDAVPRLNSSGPRDERYLLSIRRAVPAAAWVAAACKREALVPGGFGTQIYEDVGFGRGVHACVGQTFARVEGEAVLRALAERVETIEPAGEPRRRDSNTLRSWASLPVRVTPRRGSAGSR
jgi:hypothetical protein